MSLHLEITGYTWSMSSSGAGIIGMYPTVVISDKYGDNHAVEPCPRRNLFLSVVQTTENPSNVLRLCHSKTISAWTEPICVHHWDYRCRLSISLVIRCADLMKILWKGWTKASFFTNSLGSFRWLLILI